MERKWIWRRWQYDSADGVINLFTNTDMSDISWMQHLPIFSMKQSVAKMFGYILKGLLVLPFISDHRSLLAGTWSQQWDRQGLKWNTSMGWLTEAIVGWRKESALTKSDRTAEYTSPLASRRPWGALLFVSQGREGAVMVAVASPAPVSEHACSSHALPPQLPAQPWGWVLLPWAQPDSVSCLLLWGHSQPQPRITEYFRLD